MAAPGAVLLDTDVWSTLYGPPKASPIQRDRLAEAVRGRAVAIAMQTRAEVLSGIEHFQLGPRRREQTIALLDQTALIPVDEIRSSVRMPVLYATCRRAGHPLHEKVHVGDRWIAATAIAAQLPLLTLDGMYRGAPGCAC
ncbi:MAG: PIN domain-containing protein [Geodermatophilaceae bacterium]